MSGYWMMDFTEEERQKIGALTIKQNPTQSEIELIERWNTARIAHQTALRNQIEANRATSLTAANNRIALLSSSITNLQNLAELYTAEYENTLGGDDDGK